MSENTNKFILAPSGAQGVTISACLFVYFFIFLSLDVSGLSQVSVSSLTYIVEQTEPKILLLVVL